MIIGLTGGIACGKSTVARLLVARGAALVDADRIARDVVEPGSPALVAIAQTFGGEMIQADGRLDRPRLGALVFSDDAARARLNALMAPAIAAESVRRLAEAVASGAPLVVYDAALIVEWGQADRYRPLVVVWAPPEVQRARLMARDGLDAAAADARIASQLAVTEKVRVADHVIDNGGSPDATAAQVEALWQTLPI
ncbi:MAG: dephospho-CoA kinase [Myxococcales bacterium]|nr:dephospho-CoA kinase [Myxococcales bacterium]MCB9547701.1 dephospho-CoA kinase [Myxococcales bacterium]